VAVGFAAESDSLEENARAKLAAKGLDLIVANDITSPEAGFAADTNRVTLISRGGAAEAHPLRTKAAVARTIVDRIETILSSSA
jgi:phosphopantothenoylcysteine decarboxylase/phosphopantothenate--cysteine ligase